VTRTLPSGRPRTETLSSRTAAYNPKRNRLRLLSSVPTPGKSKIASWMAEAFELSFDFIKDYVAAGGRVPWRIKFRDYLACVLISIGIVGVVLLIAFYEAHKTR
jgi:hypothetical protein